MPKKVKTQVAHIQPPVDRFSRSNEVRVHSQQEIDKFMREVIALNDRLLLRVKPRLEYFNTLKTYLSQSSIKLIGSYEISANIDNSINKLEEYITKLSEQTSQFRKELSKRDYSSISQGLNQYFIDADFSNAEKIEAAKNDLSALVEEGVNLVSTPLSLAYGFYNTLANTEVEDYPAAEVNLTKPADKVEQKKNQATIDKYSRMVSSYSYTEVFNSHRAVENLKQKFNLLYLPFILSVVKEQLSDVNNQLYAIKQENDQISSDYGLSFKNKKRINELVFGYQDKIKAINELISLKVRSDSESKTYQQWKVDLYRSHHKIPEHTTVFIGQMPEGFLEDVISIIEGVKKLTQKDHRDLFIDELISFGLEFDQLKAKFKAYYQQLEHTSQRLQNDEVNDLHKKATDIQCQYLGKLTVLYSQGIWKPYDAKVGVATPHLIKMTDGELIENLRMASLCKYQYSKFEAGVLKIKKQDEYVQKAVVTKLSLLSLFTPKTLGDNSSSAGNVNEADDSAENEVNYTYTRDPL